MDFGQYANTITVHWSYAILRPWFFHSPPFPKSNLSLLLKMKGEGGRQNPKQCNARRNEAKQEHSLITITGQNVKNHKTRWLNAFYEAMKCLASIQHIQYWFQEYVNLWNTNNTHFLRESAAENTFGWPVLISECSNWRCKLFSFTLS